jgi:hypothetical protein
MAGPGVKDGDVTQYFFPYGTSTMYAAQTPTGTVGACPPGTTNPQYCSVPKKQNVSASITGLAPAQTYHFRIVATNPDGTTFGADQMFTTASVVPPPVAITRPATHIGTTFATLNGVAGPGDPPGVVTQYFFQYGTTKNYGSQTPTGTVGHCPPGITNPLYCSVPPTQHVSATIHGLKSGQKYHFRIVATNPGGTTMGSDEAFTTHSVVPIKSVTVAPHHVRPGHFFEVVVRLDERSRLTISLVFRGHAVHKFDLGLRDGTVKQRIRAPGRAGRYTVRVEATAKGVTHTVDEHVRVT